MRFKQWLEAHWYNGERYLWYELEKLLSDMEAQSDKPLYVSFTRIDKLGVNPHSEYHTPVGIYSYPLEYVTSIGFEQLPYAGDTSYLNVFSVDGNIVNTTDPPETFEKYFKQHRPELVDIIPNESSIELAMNKFVTDVLGFGAGSQKQTISLKTKTNLRRRLLRVLDQKLGELSCLIVANSSKYHYWVFWAFLLKNLN